MNDNSFSGALPADTTAPHASALPAVKREEAAGQLRDTRGRFAKAHRIVDATPWQSGYVETTEDALQDLRDRINRRAKRQRFVRNACVFLCVAIITYMATQLLRLAI